MRKMIVVLLVVALCASTMGMLFPQTQLFLFSLVSPVFWLALMMEWVGIYVPINIIVIVNVVCGALVFAYIFLSKTKTRKRKDRRMVPF